MKADEVDGGVDGCSSIGEVAGALNLPQHVLRFWETRFPEIKPVKRAGGRRSYRPEDVALLRAIRDLLYADGYTIRGVQRLLRDQGPHAFGAEPPSPQPARIASMRPDVANSAAWEARLGAVLVDLVECRDLLERARTAARR